MRSLVLVLIVLLPAVADAQSPRFGSSHDPLEAPLDPQRLGAARLAAFGGPSYIGVSWHVAAGVEAEGSIGPFVVALDGRARLGTDGLRRQDFSEVYDIVRSLRYARIQPGPRQPLYLRFGPLQRTTLGSGLLVHDFSTTSAWDERTVGAEVAFRLPLVEIGGFTGDVRLQDLTGAYVRLNPPLPGIIRRLPSLELHAVHDLGLDDDVGTTAVGAEASIDLFEFAAFRLTARAAHARMLNYGHGSSVAVNFGSEDVADFGAISIGVGLTRSTDQFVPGYFNAFYPVTRPGSAIVSSDDYFRNRNTQVLAGTAIDDAPGGTGLFLELHGLVFGAFEFRQFVRRDFGGPTGMYGVRLAITPDRGRDIRFLFDLQRQGLLGFRDLFSDLVDEAVLTFRLDYTVSSPLRLFVASHYGYRSVDPLPDGTERYLVERRFEPMFGVMLYR